jgi:hypothetical protein
MDTTDPAVKQELERRLQVIETEEVGDPAHDAFPRADLIALVALVVLSIVVGLIAGL